MRPQQPERIQEEPNQSGFASFKKGATIGAIAGGILGISAGVSLAIGCEKYNVKKTKMLTRFLYLSIAFVDVTTKCNYN